MRKLARMLRRLWVGDDGPTSVEYAILLTLILAIALSVRSLGKRSRLTFLRTAVSIQAANKGS